ncbi:MAG: ATP-binding protein [Dehalococcoidia bacterium]|nr:ATP-binding protein [Dehalococcoidia bacterium]
MNSETRLGIVVSGSLSDGVSVRMDSHASVEDIVVGHYVTIEGQKHRFLGMITDVKLDASDPHMTFFPPSADDDFSAEVLSGTSAYGLLNVTPYLVIGDATKTGVIGPQPVKTIPSHFSKVGTSSDSDIELVFGKEDDKKFWIGNPLDMETKLCLDLPELVTRSNGIFGKSGTGKTFLTRMILIGILQKSAAVNLVFDMHSEYGWKHRNEKGREVKALKQLFPSKVAIFTLDEENAKMRSVAPDFTVKIGYDEIAPEDISLLRQTLSLTDLAVEASFSLRKHFGNEWIKRTLELEASEDSAKILNILNIHESSFQSLKRGLNTLKRLSFIQPHVEQQAVSQILRRLENGTHVVLEFGRYTDITAYILVANLLTRRIYDSYRERTERSIADGSAKPKPLVITIEEAHKFLNTEVASQTIFGTIAREMRKYYCTLLVIDQRPSGIDPEVMSQLGTKITCLLDNERDIDSVLAGTSGKNGLKGVLAKLAAKQQALIFGHAVPMPVAFSPREYGADGFYRDISPEQSNPKEVEEAIDNLWR